MYLTLTKRLARMPNYFEDKPFILHNITVMLNDELQQNVVDLFCTSANLFVPTLGRGAEFCSCVQTVFDDWLLSIEKGCSY